MIFVHYKSINLISKNSKPHLNILIRKPTVEPSNHPVFYEPVNMWIDQNTLGPCLGLQSSPHHAAQWEAHWVDCIIPSVGACVGYL